MVSARVSAGSRANARPANGLLAARSVTVGVARALFVGLSSTAAAAPVTIYEHYHDDVPEEEGTALWVLYVASMVLVLLGGAFAGLTIALMGQDGIYLQVVSQDHTEPQRKNAKRVFDLLQKGKHWVLVTLLLSNVIVNETLPVVLDRCLGGGVAAVVGSTFLIVIFGEIIPQSLCVRYGLQIGGVMSKPVLLLMYLTAPIAWPTAKLLDKLLGADHGTVYKKSGLKTLVTLHKSLGDVSQRLNQDEVTIISAVLDLKEKPVEHVMTPMNDVFTMSEDTVLDEETMDMILSAGYSRIPIHESGKPTNFVGMLLVKILITYDPEDCNRVRDFPLATLPETRPETSCLDIVNFFQEGKSHMVLVSEYPGEDHGALGVVTLEDVIEELIGEEIIDESDVYIDVHKAIRRLAPAPKAKFRQQSEDRGAGDSHMNHAETDSTDASRAARAGSVDATAGEGRSNSPKPATFMMRRRSTGVEGQGPKTGVSVRANFEDIRQHLRHLGPSNRANNPKETRLTTVKIKPGFSNPPSQARPASAAGHNEDGRATDEDENTPLLRSQPHEDVINENEPLLRPQITAKDGVHALRQTYGTAGSPNALAIPAELADPDSPVVAVEVPPVLSESIDAGTQTALKAADVSGSSPADSRPSSSESSARDSGRSYNNNGNGNGNNPYGNPATSRRYVRSGSITENVIESRGVLKVVLETTKSQDEDEIVGSVATLSNSPVESKNQSRTSLGKLLTEYASVPEEDEGEAAGESATPTTHNGDTPTAAEDRDESPSEQATGEASGGNKGSKKKNRRKKRRGGGA